MNPLSEADLNTCLKVLESSDKSAAGGDRAEESRMLDVLKQLRSRTVTADLLKRTNAGKRLNKFCKHDSQAVSQAAKTAVEAWKQCVKQEQLQAEQAAGAAEGQQHHSAEPAAAPVRSTVGALADGPARPSSTDRPGSGAAELRRQPSAPRPAAGSLARSLSAGTPGGAFAVNPPRCGNDTRDKVRVMLAEALAVGYGTAAAGPGAGGEDAGGGGGSSLQSPNLLAAAIEESLHELLGGGGQPGGEYKAKARSLCFNLKDAKNPDLRERVLSGSVPAEALVRMSAEEMASDEQKRKNKELKDWLAKEATLGLNNTASTDMFQCGRCKQRKTTYYQLQTRSADEPMTTFVTCVNCQARWKFC
ncbi:Transcription elongation factor A protein 1 [Tetrabaena socialis]|uniref:Transcription elongation factor n=1 Tax=Tetrabaena socialis TaxID=47790 RepID=A0A2J8A8I4_9CHLO|nr:Transcription elongation factor A protein 1 [Tetrabaena socialis]|eukprot:PNH08820.1 Transcription elongation factor A protein 1 [Tetrabaena socialis]